MKNKTNLIKLNNELVIAVVEACSDRSLAISHMNELTEYVLAESELYQATVEAINSELQSAKSWGFITEYRYNRIAEAVANIKQYFTE